MRPTRVILIFISGLTALFLFWGIWYVYQSSPLDDFSCTSDDLLIHEDIQMHGRYVISMIDGNGSMRVIGTVSRNGENFPISRQIHFIYTRQNNEYLLTSTHIVTFSNDKGNVSTADNHYPQFFSLPEQKLTVKILNDKYENKVIYFGGVPLFYCQGNH